MMFPNPITFAKAVLRAGVAFIRGMPVIVPAHVADSRLAKCQSGCGQFDSDARQCLACSCFVDGKVWLATERCSMGRWGRFWGL